MVAENIGYELVEKLKTEVNTLKTDVGYWRKQHQRAVKREEEVTKVPLRRTNGKEDISEEFREIREGTGVM